MPSNVVTGNQVGGIGVYMALQHRRNECSQGGSLSCRRFPKEETDAGTTDVFGRLFGDCDDVGG